MPAAFGSRSNERCPLFAVQWRGSKQERHPHIRPRRGDPAATTPKAVTAASMARPSPQRMCRLRLRSSNLTRIARRHRRHTATTATALQSPRFLEREVSAECVQEVRSFITAHDGIAEPHPLRPDLVRREKSGNTPGIEGLVPLRGALLHWRIAGSGGEGGG
jgi:hypothetical protein